MEFQLAGSKLTLPHLKPCASKAMIRLNYLLSS